jgi:DNA polymerase V
MYVVANHVKPESEVKAESEQIQMTLFDDPEEIERKNAAEKAAREKERRVQKTAIELKKKFGKNAILKGMNFKEGATAIDRNEQVGGHKA